MESLPTKEKVYAALENNKDGMTFLDLQYRFFGNKEINAEEEKLLLDCILLLNEKELIFTKKKEEIIYCSMKYYKNGAQQCQSPNEEK
jgi:hypothetical protein